MCLAQGPQRSDAGGDSVVVDSLFIVAPIFCEGFVFGPCFNMQYLVSFQICNHLAGEERAGYFTLIVSLMSCDC